MGHCARQRLVTSGPGLMELNLYQHLVPIYYTGLRNTISMRPLLAELLQFEIGIRTYVSPYILGKHVDFMSRKWGGHSLLRPPHSRKWGGHVPPVPPVSCTLGYDGSYSVW